MKNSTYNLIYRTAFSIILMIVGFSTAYSQTAGAHELAKFLILVETTEDGIVLTCPEGCAWKQLTFTLKTFNAQPIDQNGMRSVNKADDAQENALANFLFTIKKTQTGVDFEGLIGTAWTKLSFSCPTGGCHQNIDQLGMTE
ncbi:MAG: hypothetical protein ABIQ02_15150 [Saprospiraceae bacterium]